MKKSNKYTINSVEELKTLIKEQMPLFNKYKLILLDGELGVGKTTFTKCLGKEIGIQENITSPSFNFMKNYEGLVHIDLYNYKGHIDEFVPYFEDNIVVIEWSNLFELPWKKYIKINMNYINENSRELEIIEESN